MSLDLPYQLGQRLCEGAYANIYLGRKRHSASSQLYAIKVIDKNGILKSGRQTQKQIDGEVKLHQLCGSHSKPHIIEFFDSDETLHGELWICMAFAAGGDLFDKIEPDVGVDEDIARLYFRQLLSGLNDIHGRGVAHRDIKPENILLDENGHLKIADFGLAALYKYQGRKRLLNTCCGSPPYAAPEIISSYDGEKVDVWSAGIVLFALCLGSTPWNEPTGQCPLFRAFATAQGSPVYEPWNRLPRGVYDLLEGMLCIDATRRLTLSQVAAHPWLKDHTEDLDPITLAHTLMSKMQVDLSQDPASSQQRSQPTPSPMSQRMQMDVTDEYRVSQSQGRVDRGSLDFMEDDPALSQFTGSTQVLESLTQRARRFADVTGSERLTRFFSLLTPHELHGPLMVALEQLQLSPRPDIEVIRIKALDTTGCQLIGHVAAYELQNGMSVVEFVKRKGDPTQWRRLFKSAAYAMRDTIYTGQH